MKVTQWLKKEVKETQALLHQVPAMLMTLFVISLVMMNLLANKSININLSWLALDAGIILAWLPFLTMDILVKTFGPRAATRLTVIAIALNILVAGLFAAGAAIPGLWGESFIETGGTIANTALDNTLGGTWYVLLGSSISCFIAALVNNSLNWGVGKLFKKNPNGFAAFATRSSVSTLIAQFVDNLLFALLISLNFFGWTLLQCFMCALTGAVVELVCQIIFSPLGYRVSKKWAEKGIGSEHRKEGGVSTLR